MAAETKRVRVEYFAILRDQRGCDAEAVDTCAGTARDLYVELQQRHGLSLDAAAMRVAVNGEFQAWDTALGDGDEVVFIPPVAGG